MTMGKNRVRTVNQAQDLQRLGYDIGMSLQPDLSAAKTPEDRARLAKAYRDAVSAWETAAERVRIARGRPLPGAYRPASPPPQRRQRLQLADSPGAPPPLRVEQGDKPGNAA